MTDDGNSLVARANAEGVGVVIDAMVIGQNKLQGLSNIDSSFFDKKYPLDSKQSNDKTLIVKASGDNHDFDSDYQINTVGLLAHMANDTTEVVYATAEADTPFGIPSINDIKFQFYINFSITDDKGVNITVETTNAGLVSNDTFSSATSSLSSQFSNYATASQLSSAIDRIPSSFNADSLSGFATNSSVAMQIASAESYASSVAVSAAIGSTNWVNTLSAGTDLNTTIGVGRYVLLPNGNYGHFPTGLDTTKQGYMEVIPDVYGNASQNITINGNHVQAIRFKQPDGWVDWQITATLKDTNSAYQNAVNTVSNNTSSLMSSANSTINSLTSIANSLVAKFPPLPSWIPSSATHLTSGQLDNLPQKVWYYLAPNDLANGQYTHVPTGNYALDNTQYYLLYYNPYNASFNFGGRTYYNSQVYIFNANGPWTEATFSGNSWSNGF